MRRYGYKPDLRDFRDVAYVPTPETVPNHVDLRTSMPPVYDQGRLGSCTANALAAAFDFDRAKQGKEFLSPSRLFIYWNERDLEGTVDSDAGAAIRDGVKVLKKIGVCPESDWPYRVTRYKAKPTREAFAEASSNEALTYRRINRALNDMRSALASGFPFVAGISVYDSFESAEVASSGVVPMPVTTEQLFGGHAIVIVGYDDASERFTCRNSWGTDWGIEGYFYLPYAYMINKGLASDMWVIKTVEAA